MLSQTGCRASGACARGVIDHVCVALALQAVAEEARGTCVAPWCGRQADCKPASPKEPAQQAEASGEADGGREAAAQEAKPIQDGGGYGWLLCELHSTPRTCQTHGLAKWPLEQREKCRKALLRCWRVGCGSAWLLRPALPTSQAARAGPASATALEAP